MHTQSMIDGLVGIHVTGVEIPLMDFIFDATNLSFLEQNINQFDYIIIPSPAVIDYVQDAIKSAFKPTFITVGKASGAKIGKLTHRDVLFPTMGAGGMALFNEKIQQLDLQNKMVLVVKGEGGNEDLYAQMAKHNIKWTTLDIYKRVMHELEPDYLKKMLIIEGLQGIIITTSILVEWLFEQAEKSNCVDLLKSCLFITIHPQIEKKLIEFGALKILVTPRTERSAVIELIRGLL